MVIVEPAPRLGLATTEELYRELMARFTIPAMPHDDRARLLNVERAIVLAEQLGSLSAFEREYRTVDS